MKLFNSITRMIAVGAAAAALVVPGMAVGQDWDAVPRTEMKLFQTGQASWEWLLIPTDHGTSGARRMREGVPCLSCHRGEEVAIGNVAASGQRLEPEPIGGMPGSIDLGIQVAVVDNRLHLRLSWPVITGNGAAGDSDFAAKVTVLIADKGLPAARAATCWASCHSDLAGMSADSGAGLTKYLPGSRTAMSRTGGGENIKTRNELDAEIEKGAFLEFWTAALSAEDELRISDGYFLEARVTNDDVALEATGRRDGERWVVELNRPLAPESGPRKTLLPGQTYPISFAVHENYTKGRRHFVSFPYELTIQAADSAGINEVLE